MNNQEASEQAVGGFELLQEKRLYPCIGREFKRLFLERSCLVNAGRMYAQSNRKGNIDYVL